MSKNERLGRLRFSFLIRTSQHNLLTFSRILAHYFELKLNEIPMQGVPTRSVDSMRSSTGTMQYRLTHCALCDSPKHFTSNRFIAREMVLHIFQVFT